MCDLDWTVKYADYLEPELDFLRVYLISDRSLLPRHRFLEGIESALRGGVRCLQLREKDLPSAELAALARAVREVTRSYDARLFINGHPEIAAETGADGVHLGEDGVGADEVKRAFPGLLVGVSTHSPESARAAEARGADFITFSPIFDTPSKRRYGPPQGLQRLRRVAENAGIPVLALGGVKQDNIPSVAEQGAHGVALISGIWSSPNIEEASQQYMRYFAGEPS